MRVELGKLVKRLRRKASEARRLANLFQSKQALEAYKCSLGEYLAYRDSANRLEKIIGKS